MSPDLCPKCSATVEAGSAFCTNCGKRLPEQTAETAKTLSAEAEPAASRGQCPFCNAVVEPDAAFCTTCGVRLKKASASASAPVVDVATVPAPAAAVTSVPGPASPVANVPAPAASAVKAAETAKRSEPSVVPAQTVPLSSAKQVSAAAAMAAEPAYAVGSQAASQPELAGASSGSKVGPIVIVVLLLVILGAGAMLWLRPSSSSTTSKVLIVTPSPASVTIEPDSTTTLSVAVQGDGGAGMIWKVAENYGGTVQPAGVSVQGEEVVYKATYHSGQTPGDYHVLATSQANKDVRVSVVVHVAR